MIPDHTWVRIEPRDGDSAFLVEWEHGSWIERGATAFGSIERAIAWCAKRFPEVHLVWDGNYWFGQFGQKVEDKREVNP